jgi:hypothetical protein
LFASYFCHEQAAALLEAEGNKLVGREEPVDLAIVSSLVDKLEAELEFTVSC